MRRTRSGSLASRTRPTPSPRSSTCRTSSTSSSSTPPSPRTAEDPEATTTRYERISTVAQSVAEDLVWVFRKEYGGWWNEATLDGHVLTVGPSTGHMWTAAVDDRRVGRRATETAARDLAIREARHARPVEAAI